jgi:uncharacterized membrane protein (DUF485 family)
MGPAEQEEYRSLRATIRERGTARIWVFFVGLVAWAALLTATAALAALPVATLLPLLVLMAAFEAVFSLHVGVERIGRYVQVFLENERGWEHAAMAYGEPLRGTRVDPLFSVYFLLATVANFVPVLLAEPVAMEVWVVGVVHLFVAIRIVLARRAASRQRAADLKRFLELKAG